MLFLAQAILKAAGVEYDEVGETWVVHTPLRSVAIECDKNETYMRQTLREVKQVLRASGCTQNRFSINGRYVSNGGLVEVAATA